MLYSCTHVATASIEVLSVDLRSMELCNDRYMLNVLVTREKKCRICLVNESGTEYQSGTEYLCSV